MSCFRCTGLFFALGEWEKGHDDEFGIRRGAEKVIRKHQAIVERLPFVPVFISGAFMTEVMTAGSLILDALFRREAKKIKEAEVHLKRLENFLSYKGEPLTNLETITKLEEDSPSFSQVLFFLKEQKVQYLAEGNIISFVHFNKPVHVMLPLNLSLYSNQLLSYDEYRKVTKEGYARFVFSSLPNNLKGIHKII